MDLAAVGVEANVGAPIVVLREHDEPHRLLPIFVGAPEADAIAMAATGQETERPMSHDLMAMLLLQLGGRLTAVEVTGMDEGTFVAELKIETSTDQRRVDARPSDAIALAVRLDAPVFVSDDVLDEMGALPLVAENVPDQTTIDEEVSDFRAFLDDLDPARFGLDDPDAGPETDGQS